MEQSDRPRLSDLELPAVFPENRFPSSPLAELGNLPAPGFRDGIPLPNKEPRPRIVIADDDREVINGLERSWQASYPKALDVRFWQPGNGTSLVEMIKECMLKGWRPDVVVIDINMDVGARHGIHYLEDLRNQEGCAALAVVLATGNQYSDLNEGTLSAGQTNLTGEDPGQWLGKARKFEPEALLYGKNADANFLGRIGENLPDWQRAARRRAWVGLLSKIAQRLDGPSIKVKIVAEEIVNYAIRELEIDDAFVRWRREDDQYELVAAATTREMLYVRVGSKINPATVPILQNILDEERDPVIRERLSEEESGDFSQNIADYHFLGVGMVLGNRSVGFITLLREPCRRSFEKEIDGQHLAVLARLLASAMGRDAFMRDRQIRLLEFAGAIEQTSKEIDVCDSLVTILHRELQNNDNERAKATVRLLDFGRGVLERRCLKGMPSAEQDIAITNRQSIYAACVRDNMPYRIADVCAPESQLLFTNLCLVDGVHSELCVPLTIGEHAIGAVNMEHLDDDYYRFHDEAFAQAAAGLAASAIERIRTFNVLNGMTDFVYRFASEETPKLDSHLRELLYDFCSYSVLVDLNITGEGHWSVQHVDSRFLNANREGLRQQIEASYADHWEQTWISKQYRDRAWEKDWAHFTNNKLEFLPVAIARGDDQNIYQRADALLWLRRGMASPHRALLLMWYLPPPMNEAGVRLLGSLARLFSELDNRKQSIRELMEQKLLSEKTAELGNLMQHFRHRLGNLTGSQATHIERVRTAYEEEDKIGFQQAFEDLQANALDIANSFNRSRGYLKTPEITGISLSEVVTKACSSKELALRLQNVDLQIEVPDSMQVWTDLEIASMVLYSLLENALDSIEGQAYRTIKLGAETKKNTVILRVSDNGSGVPEGIRLKLFELGVTTKSDGLGSSIAFARNRMRSMSGDVVFSARQPAKGASFEMHFPSLPKESRQ